MTSPAALLSSQPSLSRSISLTQATLYGLGVTIGAGIYVLVGTTVAQAGSQTPIAFALAAILMGLTAASFAELAARFPVAAGEAAYVRTRTHLQPPWVCSWWPLPLCPPQPSAWGAPDTSACLWLCLSPS